MLRSLNSGVTGLLNHQTRMDVIGNNISNVNTVGYKNRRATFSESFSQLVKGASRSDSKAGGTNAMQIGLGVKVGSVDTITTQGALNNTNRVFDLAIEGNAFFGVSDGVGTYYTRNGAFQLDAEGYIILPTNGMVLQGRMADLYGNFPPGTTTGNMQIPMTQQAPAKETTEISLGKNLPMDADAKGQITYTQRFLHAADSYREAEVGFYATPPGNGPTDPGRKITPLTSLFNDSGAALNIKDGDVLTFQWTDMPSDAAVGVTKYEYTFVVKQPPPGQVDWLSRPASAGVDGNWQEGDDYTGTYDDAEWTGFQAGGNNTHFVWSLDSLIKALQSAMNGEATYYDFSGNLPNVNPPVAVPQPNQDFTDVNGKQTGQGGASGTAADALDVEIWLDATGRLQMRNSTTDADGHIFSPNLKSSNPLSTGAVSTAFSFGQYAGPGMGTYNGTELGTSNALMRPAEQFDRMEELYDSGGFSLGLEDGDPMDLDGSIGSANIANTKSGPMSYWTVQGAFDYNAAKGFTPADVGKYVYPTLFDDFLAKIRNDLLLPPDYVDRDGAHYPSVSVNGISDDPNMPYGAVVIRSMPGTDFAVSRLSVSADNSNRNDVTPANFVSNFKFSKLRNAEDVGQFPVDIEVYDSSGGAHQLTLTFVHTGRANEWEWHANFAGKESIQPGTGSGKIFFGQDGTIAAWVFDGGGSQLVADPHNGASMMKIDLNVGGPGDNKGITQFDSPYSVIMKGQDGYPSGSLVEISIDEFGLLSGVFSNGTERAIGQIMVVDFANPGGLLDLSDCIFSTSANSGDPVWGKPLSQSSSSIKPGALEMSNVDLGSEFTNMITTQRGYQANSRIVTVSDSMLEELVNLKR